MAQAGRATPRGNVIDRLIGYVSPQAGLQRMRARVAVELLARHYEGASIGRRTQGWNRDGGDANAVVGPALSQLRAVARDLVRNNGNAKSARRTITNHVVGWGIVAKPMPKHQQAADLWKAWAGTTACDSDGQNDFYGLQKLVMRTVFESGEVLVRRRFRRPEDGLPIPLQLQVLEPDYIDTLKSETRRNKDGVVVARIINGVEFDAIGKRVAYWLFREHPGSDEATSGASVRIPAENFRHVYYKERPGQVRGVSWLANVLLRFKDHDEYEDATLMKQKIAACMAVIVGDLDGSATPLGTADTSQDPQIDSLEPGWIGHVPAGTTVETIAPPSVRDYADYTKASLRTIAAGLGVTYEDLTGDYTGMPFSAARMSRMAHWDRVEDWRWQMLIPQFCDPVWAWAMEAAGVMGLRDAPAAEWTPPPAPMIDPANEGLAIMRNVRSGIQTLSEAIRERGWDPDEFLEEYAADLKKLDRYGIILDSDARRTTQAGNPTAAMGGGDQDEPKDDPEEDPDDEPDDDTEEEEEDDDAEEEAAARAHEERMALVAVAHARASTPVVLRVEKGAVQVDARTTIEKGAVQTTVDSPVTIAKDAVRVDARTIVAEGAVQLPVTIAETAHVPAGRRVIERNADGQATALVSEGVPSRIVVTKPGSKRGK